MKTVYFFSLSILFWSNVSFAQTCNLADDLAADIFIVEVLSGRAGVQTKENSCCSFELPEVRIDFSKAPFNFESMHLKEDDHAAGRSIENYPFPNGHGFCRVEREMKEGFFGQKAQLSGTYDPSNWTDNLGTLFINIESGLPEEYKEITLECGNFRKRPLEGAKVSELPMPIREAIQVPCSRIQLQQINFQYEEEAEMGVTI